jgi:zinc/manganese transport system substrate-binding protein
VRRSASPAAALALGCATLLAACGGGPAASTRGPVPVVAAENFYGSIVSQVGGGDVGVTSIIKDPSADPHEYTGNTQDTESVAHARLVVVNGAGYDGFMDRLLSAAPAPGRTVIRVDRLVGANGSDPNPHLWYEPRTAPALARALAAALAKADPAHAAVYRRGAARFVASLGPIDAEIASLRRRFAGTPFAYTERVPQYLTDRIGLKLETPPAFAKANEAGIDPSPQSVSSMRALVGGHRIKLLLYNAQASSQAAASIRDLARRSGVPVVGVSETSPPHRTYQAWQLAQLRAIDAALSRP